MDTRKSQARYRRVAKIIYNKIVTGPAMVAHLVKWTHRLPLKKIRGMRRSNTCTLRHHQGSERECSYRILHR